MPEKKKKGPMVRTGRKLKLTPELQTQITQLIQSGITIEVAARAVGITPASYYLWMKEGEADHKEGKQTVKSEFFEAVFKATSLSEIFLVQIIQKQAPSDWRAASWLLERRFPDRYAAQQRTETKHTGTIQHEHKSIIVHLPAVVAEGRKVKRIEATAEPAGDQQETTPDL